MVRVSCRPRGDSIVVNASAGIERAQLRSTRVPLKGELRALLADKDVLYDQTTAVRRRALLRRFWLADTPPRIGTAKLLSAARWCRSSNRTAPSKRGYPKSGRTAPHC